MQPFISLKMLLFVFDFSFLKKFTLRRMELKKIQL